MQSLYSVGCIDPNAFISPLIFIFCTKGNHAVAHAGAVAPLVEPNMHEALGFLRALYNTGYAGVLLVVAAPMSRRWGQ